MDAKLQQPKEREGAISDLNAAIEALNLAEKVSRIIPTKVVFGSVIILLMTIKVRSPFFCDVPLQAHTQLGHIG